jgi:serine protease
VKISKLKTLQEIRKMNEVTFVEVNGYPIDMEVIRAFTGTTSTPQHKSNLSNARTEMILDPYLQDPEYAQQVLNYDNTLGVVLQRHNIDDVYRQYQNFGEGVGIAVIDNGIVPFARELFETNGYGERYTLGYHNPLWFLPWEAGNNDGIEPLESDALGISVLFEPQWLHGSGMIQSAFVVAPNSNITCVRGSTAIVILFPSMIYGISNAIKAMADREEVQVTNMSMGTFFYVHRIAMAINYYDSKGKILASAAGTSFEEIKDLLGVIFPANLPNTIAVTGIENRETTNGEFVEGSTAHTGIHVDFCVEKSAASSEATARMVGMFALIWSANPELTRAEVLDIAIRASHFYQLQGFKDPSFGWGTVDMLQAVEMAMAE